MMVAVEVSPHPFFFYNVSFQGILEEHFPDWASKYLSFNEKNICNNLVNADPFGDLLAILVP
jgi:hypothetical protein